MPITVLTGLPGSGKSSHLIETVNAAIKQGRAALTFVCSEYPWPSNHGAFLVRRRLVCGKPGLTCQLNHFVSTTEFGTILRRVNSDALVAVEESYTFAPNIVGDWLEASARGLELVIAVPSYQQMQLLKEADYREINFEVKCEICRESDATIPALSILGEGAQSICTACFARMKQLARKEIIESLKQQEPFAGEAGMYQPVELPELSDWRLARPDSDERADAMIEIMNELGLLRSDRPDRLTYLDIGCNTGHFCDRFANLGFKAKGVDATAAFIRVARLLDSFFRRQKRPGKEFVIYECANAFEYLQDTKDQLFDVTSAFAVFQWVMIQRSVDHGISCLKQIFAKTKHVCFIEMGYTKEEMYKQQLPIEIDRKWVMEAMKTYGGFEDIRVIEGGRAGVQRDLFVGLKNIPQQSAIAEIISPNEQKPVLKESEYQDLMLMQAEDNQTFELIIQSIYSRVLQTGDCCVDGGAHTGLHTLPMARLVGSQGVVYAFEPIPSIARHLQQRLTDHGVQNVNIVERALYHENKTVGFHIVENVPTRSGIEKTQYPFEPQFQVLEVETVVLDDVLSEAQGWRFGKFDLEGGEFRALQGARQVIQKFAPFLVFERSAAAPYWYGYTVDEFVKFFQELNYNIYDLFGRPLGVEEWNLPGRPWYAIGVPAGSENEHFVKEELGKMLVTMLAQNRPSSEKAETSNGRERAVPRITASPNPVPAGCGNGTTTISWDTGDGSMGEVYVSVNDLEEKLFYRLPSGSRDAPWINAPGEYNFYLYEGFERKSVLASVTVTRHKQ
ncbi:MAG: FkbM family methyltransferase [Acidobacteriota bacterium]